MTGLGVGLRDGVHSGHQALCLDWQQQANAKGKTPDTPRAPQIQHLECGQISQAIHARYPTSETEKQHI